MRARLGPVICLIGCVCLALPFALVATAQEKPADSALQLTATLPHAPSEGLPPAVLDELTDGRPVLLDLTLMPPLTPSLKQADGMYVLAESCDFGVVEAGIVSVPTGSYHMLLDVALGSREQHPANLFSCEYDPGLMTEDHAGHRWRLRGCFLPHSVSIPTATLWALNPLPASACGIGN